MQTLCGVSQVKRNEETYTVVRATCGLLVLSPPVRRRQPPSELAEFQDRKLGQRQERNCP